MVAQFNAQEIEMMISAIAFDFDGTLTRPEGIDFYAIRRSLSTRSLQCWQGNHHQQPPMIDTAAAIDISINHGEMGAHPVPEHDSACHELCIVLGFYLQIG